MLYSSAVLVCTEKVVYTISRYRCIGVDAVLASCSSNLNHAPYITDPSISTDDRRWYRLTNHNLWRIILHPKNISLYSYWLRSRRFSYKSLLVPSAISGFAKPGRLDRLIWAPWYDMRSWSWFSCHIVFLKYPWLNHSHLWPTGILFIY